MKQVNIPTKEYSDNKDVNKVETSGKNNNKLSVSLGNSNIKTTNLSVDEKYGSRLLNFPMSSGWKLCLISDISNIASYNRLCGFKGRFILTKQGFNFIPEIFVSCLLYGYSQDKFSTSYESVLIPCACNYNNKQYLGLLYKGYEGTAILDGVFFDVLDEFIYLTSTSNELYPEIDGVEFIWTTACKKYYEMIAENIKDNTITNAKIVNGSIDYTKLNKYIKGNLHAYMWGWYDSKKFNNFSINGENCSNNIQAKLKEYAEKSGNGVDRFDIIVCFASVSNYRAFNLKINESNGNLMSFDIMGLYHYRQANKPFMEYMTVNLGNTVEETTVDCKYFRYYTAPFVVD